MYRYGILTATIALVITPESLYILLGFTSQSFNMSYPGNGRLAAPNSTVRDSSIYHIDITSAGEDAVPARREHIPIDKRNTGEADDYNASNLMVF